MTKAQFDALFAMVTMTGVVSAPSWIVALAMTGFALFVLARTKP